MTSKMKLIPVISFLAMGTGLYKFNYEKKSYLQSNRKYILGLGNPIIDILAKTDEETIKRLEIPYGKCVFISENNKEYFNLLESKPEVTYVPGGSVTNSIRVTNWLLNNNSNYGCILLGSVGNDNYAKRLIDSLEEVNVLPLLEIKEGKETSRCAVGVVQKERCLVGDIKASSLLSLDFVKENLNTINNAELALIEGYFIPERFDIVSFIVDYFNKNGKKIAFTLGAVFLMENYYDKMLEVANKSDVIFCNIEEACAFAKFESEDSVEIANKIHSILTPRDRILVITHGSNPVIISKYDYSKNIVDFEVKKYIPKLAKENIVDTNGCGDSFVGGFLSQYIKGESLVKCSQAGVFASSVIIQNVGCSWKKDTKIDI